MLSFESDTMLVDDREDLIALLRMRFGRVPGELIESIYEINDMNTLQRLILAAANAASWNVFLKEFQTGNDAFRLVGEDFNPLGRMMKGREIKDGEEKK